MPGLIIACLLLTLAVVLFFQLAAHPTASTLSVGPRIIKTIGWTTLQASLSTILSLAIGLTLCWALSHRKQFAGRSLYIALLSSALVLPTIVVILGIVSLLGRSGWVNDALEHLNLPTHEPIIFGLAGIVIAHCYFNASYVARTLLSRFESIPTEQVKLTRSLGLNAWQRFKMIELPAVSSTIPTLAITIFLLCFTSFSIVLILGGSPKFNTLEVSIYEAIKLDFNLGRALGLALTQLAICATLVVIGARFGKDNKLIATANVKPQPWSDSLFVSLLQAAIIALFGLAFALPLVAVLIDGIAADYRAILTDPYFQRATITSLLIATLSTLLVLLISTLLAISFATLATEQRLGKHNTSRFVLRLLSFSSTLYLAVPSLVLGLGFFLLARTIGGDHTVWALVALLTSNVLMVLPFAIGTLAPAMIKAANRYDKLAFSLGIKKWARWRLIESHLLRPELTYVASLAFCMSLGDLGIIALFGNQDFVTLPWLLYQKMGSYRTDEAAGIALVMLCITLTVFLLLPMINSRRDADHHAKT